MKKALLLASFCLPVMVARAEDRRPADSEEEVFTVESRVTIPKDTPAEVKRAIRLELEESCIDMKKEFELLDGVRVESKCVECGCGQDAPHAVAEDKCADCGKEDNKEDAEQEDAAKCGCTNKPRPKK